MSHRVNRGWDPRDRAYQSERASVERRRGDEGREEVVATARRSYCRAEQRLSLIGAGRCGITSRRRRIKRWGRVNGEALSKTPTVRLCMPGEWLVRGKKARSCDRRSRAGRVVVLNGGGAPGAGPVQGLFLMRGKRLATRCRQMDPEARS